MNIVSYKPNGISEIEQCVQTHLGWNKTRCSSLVNFIIAVIMVALLSVAFCWCQLTGEWKSKRKPIATKKHGRKAMSLFRYGLDAIRETILNSSYKTSNFK